MQAILLWMLSVDTDGGTVSDSIGQVLFGSSGDQMGASREATKLMIV